MNNFKNWNKSDKNNNKYLEKIIKLFNRDLLEILALDIIKYK